MRHRILDHLLAAQPALAGVVEFDRVAMDLDVLLTHRGKPDAVILVGVLLAANAEHAYIEQPDGRRQHRLSVKVVGITQNAGQAPAQARQRIGEAQHPLELGSITVLAPARVIQVLPAPRRVDARGLEMAERIRADPYILPGRRDDQIADARELLGRFDPPALRIDVAEPAATANPANPRTGAIRTA